MKTATEEITVDSLLTTSILIPCGTIPESYDLNCFGEMAKFIGRVTIINQETKECKILKFESKELFELSKVNVHEAWVAFHEKVLKEYPKHMVEFVASHQPAKKILV
jgi:hypothetical protein